MITGSRARAREPVNYELDDEMKKIKSLISAAYQVSRDHIISKWLPFLKKYRFGIGFFAVMFPVWYGNMYSSDIRFTRVNVRNNINFTIKERCYDASSNKYIYYCSIRPTFKNKSFKTDHIDKVELVPMSACPLPETKILYIGKNSIGWFAEKEIEIYFVVILPGYIDDKSRKENKIGTELFLQVLNKDGGQIDRFTDGEYVRLTTSFWAK